MLVEEIKKKTFELELKRRQSASDLDFLPKMQTGANVIAFAKKHQVSMVDFTFVDVPGTLQHTTKPVHELAGVFEGGAGFDGSSIRGFQQIEESDMLLIPQASSAFLDMFSGEPTIGLLCDVQDPTSGKLYDSSPRTIARRATEYLKKNGHSGYRDGRSGSGVLHLRLRPLRPVGRRSVLCGRFGGSHLEHWPRRRGRKPRLQDLPQGRLFSRSAYGQHERNPHGDGPRA